MAVDSNGRLAELGLKGMNGHAKAPLKSKTTKKQKGFSIVSTISRYVSFLENIIFS
jgi:hypothetical protein